MDEPNKKVQIILAGQGEVSEKVIELINAMENKIEVINLDSLPIYSIDDSNWVNFPNQSLKK